jgi:hypothetical protein
MTTMGRNDSHYINNVLSFITCHLLQVGMTTIGRNDSPLDK